MTLSALGKADKVKRELDECGRPSPSLREITEARIKVLHERQLEGRRDTRAAAELLESEYIGS